MRGADPAQPIVITQPQPAGATWVRYQVLVAGCLLALLTYVQRLGFSSALPEIKQQLNFNNKHTGYLSAAFLIAYGGFQMVGGVLGDRFGARHVLTILVLSWSLLTGAVALTVLLPSVVALQLAFLLATAVPVRRAAGRRLSGVGPRARRLDAG